MFKAWPSVLLQVPITGQTYSSGLLYVFLFVLSMFLYFSARNRKSRQSDFIGWPNVKLDAVHVGRRQIIDEIRLAKFPTSIEQIFAILDPKSSRILWLNEDTFLSINGWGIKRLMETSDVHRMLALDFTCSRRHGPWKRIHIYSRSSQTAFEAILYLMDLEHQFNTVDICYHHDISELDSPLAISALTPEHIQTMLTVKPNCDIEIGFEGLRFGPEQSAALARYSRSLNLGHATTVDGLCFITALRKREYPVHSLSFRERPFDDANWSLFLAHIARSSEKRLVRSLTLFHGCFVGPHDCQLLVKARVESLNVHSACFHDDGEALTRAVASGVCPSRLHISGYQADSFTRVVLSLADEACTLKSLWISLASADHDDRLRTALQRALAKNRSLEALTIDNVSIVSEWVGTFATLVSHQTLTKLSLHHIEQTSNEAAQEIVRLLESNRNLEILYSFSGSSRKQCRDAWKKTIEHTLRFNRFLRNAIPFVSDSKDHYREALFNAALGRNRHDSRRLAMLLFQNADLLANVKPVGDSKRQLPFWVTCKFGLAQFYETQQQKLLRQAHAFQDYVQTQADDLGERLGDALIFPSFDWTRRPENSFTA